MCERGLGEKAAIQECMVWPPIRADCSDGRHKSATATKLGDDWKYIGEHHFPT